MYVGSLINKTRYTVHEYERKIQLCRVETRVMQKIVEEDDKTCISKRS